MKPRRGVECAPPSAWTWPFDKSKYDTHPALTAHERLALKGYMDRYESGNPNHPPQFHAAASRLIVPIQDVLDWTGLAKSTRFRAINYLFREMYRRRRSFWGWKPGDWVETIRATRFFRQHHMAIAYLLCEFPDFHALTDGVFVQVAFAKKMFGADAVDAEIDRVRKMMAGWGYGKQVLRQGVPRTVAEALLINRSPRLEDLTLGVLETMRQRSAFIRNNTCTFALSQVLVSLGVTPRPLNIRFRGKPRADVPRLLAAGPGGWARWCQHWYTTSTLAPKTRTMSFYALLSIGRWLATERPEMGSPEKWTQSFAAEFVAVIDRMKPGPATPIRASRARGGRIGGNVLDFISAMENCSLREAALKLQDWFTVQPVRSVPVSQPEIEDSHDATPGGGNKPLSFALSQIDCSHPYLAGVVLTAKPRVILESGIAAERAPWPVASSYRFTTRTGSWLPMPADLSTRWTPSIASRNDSGSRLSSSISTGLRPRAKASSSWRASSIASRSTKLDCLV